MPFDAILFDPGSQASARVSVRTLGSSLEVIKGGGSESLRIDPARCELTSGGWDGQSIQISWSGPNGTFALSSNDPRALAELSALAPFESALRGAAKAGRRVRRHGALGMTLVTLLTLLPALLIAALFAFRNQVIDIVLDRIPISVDQEVGRMFERQLADSADAVEDNEATRAIGAIVDRLKAGSPHPGIDFRVKVQRSGEINAFAAPGGLIVVYSGLIKEAGSAEEVAGVLAHEMAHVTRRHSMRQLIYAAGILPLIGMLIGQADAAALVQGLGQLSELRFSRAQEEEADRIGFDALVAAGVSTDGMALFFDRLARAEGGPPPFLSTHPSSAGRAAAIRARTDGLRDTGTSPLPIDWDEVREAAR